MTQLSHTHTQTCKHQQTESSHCSSFVYTLTFSQHLSYVLYTFCKRGPFSNWGPYCSFCYKSPVWMPKQTRTHTHTHTHTRHMALMGYLIVFSIVPFLKNSLVGYYCSYWNALVGSIVLLLQVPHNLWLTVHWSRHQSQIPIVKFNNTHSKDTSNWTSNPFKKP